MEAFVVSETLEALADARTARALSKQVRPLRGVRGVSDGEVARIAAAAWTEDPPDPHQDEGELDRLFGAAFEDGLVAIGLLAALVPEDPELGWALGTRWLGRVDDVKTADALGWLVLGPSILLQGGDPAPLFALTADATHPAARRALVSAGLAWTPAPLEGPSAAPLRTRVGDKHVRFVDAPLGGPLEALVDTFRRDEDPAVRKAVRRVLRAWAQDDPAAVVAWADGVRGGLPKLLGDEVVRARRRAARLAAEEAP